MPEMSSRQKWSLFATVTVISGSLIGFSPVGINLLNFTLSENPSIGNTPSSSAEIPDLAADIHQMRDEMQGLTEKLDKHVWGRTESGAETTDSVPATTTPKPETSSQKRLKDPITMKVSLGGKVAEFRSTDGIEEMFLPEGEAEVTDIRTVDDFKKATELMEEVHNQEMNRVINVVRNQAKEYAMNHRIVDGTHLDLTKVRPLVNERGDTFVDYADLNSRVPKLVFQSRRGPIYAFDEEGNIYQENEIIDLEWNLYKTREEKDVALNRSHSGRKKRVVGYSPF